MTDPVTTSDPRSGTALLSTGVRMHSYVDGPDDGRPLVLLHGWPQTAWQFRRAPTCGDPRIGTSVAVASPRGGVVVRVIACRSRQAHLPATSGMARIGEEAGASII